MYFIIVVAISLPAAIYSRQNDGNGINMSGVSEAKTLGWSPTTVLLLLHIPV